MRLVLDEELRDSEIAYPPEELAAKEKVFTALSDEVNSELDLKWSEMKSYDEGGGSYLFLLLLLAMLALIPIFLYNGERGFSGKALQYGFYAFYPVHILILSVLAQYVF